ncbi:MAG TPA: glycosyltransferase family 39 protein [Verrucomicrobiae bacterium]|nr:glycosyltransferase family 39 protein [Verrucomicrobiae bacterium]
MQQAPPTSQVSRPLIPLFAAIAAFTVHLIGNPHYGFFRDELYFIICGRHLEWGYVDQPPITPLLAAASQIFGPSLFLLRAVPAFFAAAGVYVTCLLAVELGATAFGQIIAALVVFFTPVLMDFGMKVSPDMVGLCLWPLLALYVLRLTKGANPRLWLAIGAIMGIGLESKYSILFFAAALLAGLLLTPQRRVLFTPWFLLGCLLAGLIALPNFLWQAHHGYPMWELLRNGQHGKNVIYGPVAYVLQQFLMTGLLAPVWIIGLVWLFLRPPLRFLGYAFVVLIALMIVLHGKSYYPTNVYPFLIAAGCVVIENWTRGSRAARYAVIVAVVILGLPTVPLVMPVLPEAQLATYTDRFFRTLGLSREALATEHQRRPTLPSDFADMHGWPELAAQVAGVY